MLQLEMVPVTPTHANMEDSVLVKDKHTDVNVWVATQEMIVKIVS